MNQIVPDRDPADRYAVIALVSISALAWIYLLFLAWGMEHMDAGAGMAIMPRMTQWDAVDLALVFSMWAVMMVAMMLPSAAPMVLTFRALDRRRQDRAGRTRLAAFVAGYIAIWTAFSVAITLLQWRLLEARLVSPMMKSNSATLGGLLLIAAGVYQLTSLKQACLTTCRSPLSFMMNQWRPGNAGAFAMGAKHGVYCLGCCWLLMALLFVLGVMNLLWIVALSAFVLIEKNFTASRTLPVVSGIVFLAWGASVLYGAMR